MISAEMLSNLNVNLYRAFYIKVGNTTLAWFYNFATCCTQTFIYLPAKD